MTTRYKGDPHWIIAKYPGTDAHGRPFAKGERVFYFPNGKRIYAGPAADEASARFESERADDKGYGYAN